MPYTWREENFRGLLGAAALAEARGWPGYASYCRLRERGLRPAALRALEEFIATATAWPLPQRAAFCEWLLELEFSARRVYNLVPYPLRHRLIDPTLGEWAAASPEDPRAWRWLPAPDGPRRALALDPHDQIALRRLIGWLVGGLYYGLHEMPQDYLGSDPVADRAMAKEALDLSERLEDPAIRDIVRADARESFDLLDGYVAYVESGSSLDFEEWAARNGRSVERS
jgi:hypothetical protein